MKGKLGASRKKKTIALIATIAVLLTGAVTGVSLFLKDDGSASAAEMEQEQLQNPGQVQEPGQSDEQNLEQQPNEPNENPGEEVQEPGEDDTTGQAGEGAQTNPGTTAGNAGVTRPVGQPEEFITYRDRLVSEDFLVGWTPIGISAIADTTGRFLNSPKLQIEKISYTETDYNLDGDVVMPEEPKYTAVQSGETIIYEIRVSNIGLLDAKDIKVSDKIPEGTTLELLDDKGVEDNGTVNWVVDIPAGTQVSLKFAVVVNENVKGDIKNVAVVNGDKTNETGNTAIETEKIAEVTRKGEVVTEEARPGDTIKYTIKLTNTGDKEATTKVTDFLPVDTSLVENSITDGGEEANRIVTWEEVTVEAGKEKEISFSVTINEDAKTSIKNVATVGKTPTNETENKVANITGNKVVDKTEAKVGETLTYAIILTNSGNADGKVTVRDVVPEGTTIKDATVSGYNAKTNTMVWEDILVKAGEQVNLTLEVVIDEDRVDTVVNTAILEDEEIPGKPETKVANITGNKVVDKEEAKVGETLTYTITLTNSGNADGEVTVTDVVPAGTIIKDATIEGYDAATNTMTWENVLVKAGEQVELKLEVVINEDTKTSVVNTAILDGKEIPETPETKVANITAVKASSADEPLKEMGTIEYTITLHNSGNTAGKVTVTDQVPEGTKLVPNSIKIDGAVTNNIVLEGNKITWAEVEVGVSTDVVLSFNVTVEPFEEETKQIVNDKATIDGKSTNTTTDEAEKAYVEIEASKIWNDNNNEAGKRPQNIKLVVKNGENTVVSETITGEGNTWSHKFENLPKYDSQGNEISYTVDEEAVNTNDLYFYTKNISGNTITNTFTVPYVPVSIPVEKVWDDNEDAAEKRPDGIYLVVKNGDTEVARQEVSSNIDWKYIFMDLPKYDELGNEISYTVDEEAVNANDLYFYEEQTPTGNMEDGYTITNRFSVPDEKVVVSVEKVWNDNSNEAQKRPETIKLQLKANGANSGEEVSVRGEGNTWNYTFEGLAKYDASGDEISYTVEEIDDLYFYTEQAATGNMEDGYTITNTFSVPDVKVNVPVEKVWNDNSDSANKRPETIQLQLKANGENSGEVVTISGEGNTWSYTFEGLAKYDASGDEISYTIEEVEDLYFYTEQAATGNMEDGYTITNTFNVPDVKVEVSVEKVWNDNSNEAQKRPETIKLQLKANGENSGEEVSISGEGNTWSYTFEGLAKYDASGDEISYTVEEVEDLYFYTEQAPTGNMEDGYSITNTFSVPDEKVEVSVEKVWNDNSNEAQKRPTSIKLQLKANGANSGEEVSISGEGNTWSYTFQGLAKYDSLGNEISYTVEETEDLYFYEEQAATGNMEDGYTITNRFSVPNETVDITVEKVWNDNSNEAQKRPESVTLQVKAAGQVVRSQEVSGAGNNWSYTFEGLAKYDRLGNIINYTVDEAEVNEDDLYFYSKGISENTITNTFTVPSEKVSVSVTKVWDDNNNEACKRPLQLTLQVKNGTSIVAEQTVSGTNWSYTFENLPKYDSNGNVINYTAGEAEVTEGDLYFYEEQAPTGNMEDGYTITNMFSVPNDTIDITVNKQWNDNNNSAEKRPPSVKLVVKNGNTVVKEQVVSGTGNNWSYTFEDLTKYDSLGNEISYTVDEEAVKPDDLYFYAKNISGNTIINTFNVPDEKVDVPVEKVWNDNNDAADKRPTSIELQLKANGENSGETVTIRGEGNTWSYTFQDLAKYDSNGNEINYTVEEVEDLYFYTEQAATGNMEDGYTITNTFNVPDVKVEVSVEKVWNDNSNEAQKRPETIKLQLKANGENSGEAVTIRGEGNTWSYTFQGLAKYDSLGDEISYTVEEVEDLYFYTEQEPTGNMEDGYTITNTFNVPDEKVEVSVEKVWNDNSNKAQKRPETIKLQLKANGANSGETVTISGEGNTWSYTFTSLAKYDSLGNEISYTVEEVEDLYFYTEQAATGNMEDGYTITNTFSVPDVKIPVTITKQWVDTEAQSVHRPESIVLQVKAAGEVVRSTEVTANIGWKYTFEDLPKYDAYGNEINYTAGEVIDSKFYERTDDGSTTTVTNTFKRPTDTKPVTITKQWVDTAEQAVHRPEKITLQVKAAGEVVRSEEISGTGNNWSHTFEGLPVYDENGNEINYTAGEVIDSIFYERTDDGSTTTVTNTFTRPTDTIPLTVTKVWVDGDGSTRPTSIKVQVKNGSSIAKETVLSGDKTAESWSYTFQELDKYDSNGNEISYTVDEVEINTGDLENYSKSINNETYTITNTYTPPVLNVTKTSQTPSKVKAGDTITYTITVTNTGDGIARNVVVRDDLDLSLVEFVSASDGGQLNGNQVVWNIDSLVAETGSKQLTLTVRVKNTAKLGITITNIATVDGGEAPSAPVEHTVETVINTLAQSETITGTNVVIVIDLSSSMNNEITGANGKTTTRLAAAKTAAENFINKVFPEGVTTGNQVSVVTFNYKNASDQDAYNTTVSTDAKYKGTKVFTFTSRNTNKTIATNATEAEDLIEEINGIELGTNLGTNIAAALETTKTQVNALKALKPENRNVVVFLGDGAPSPYRKDGEWRSKYAGNVESNIVDLASQIKAIKNVPASSDITPVNTIIHTIGFGVTSTTDENLTQCCTNASNHNAHNHKYNSGLFGRTYIQDSYGYYYVEESDSTIATRILQRMSSGEGYYHLSDNGAGLINNFNSVFSSTAKTEGIANTTNGIATITLATRLDTTKNVILTVNGVDTEVAYSAFAANGLTYTESGTTYTLTWDVTQYNANTTLKITYNTL